MLKTDKVDLLLKKYVEARIIPCYDSFDKAHQRDHVLTVIDQSLELAEWFPEADVNMVYAIAAYHDIGLVEGRETHHFVSARMMLADGKLRQWFDEKQLKLMAEAVEDHRASSEHDPRSLYGRIVAEADRQIEEETVLRRTVQYGLKNYPELDREGHFLRLMEHMRQKYMEGGYLKLWIAESRNAVNLNRLREMLKDEQKVRTVFDRIYDEETASLHKK